MDGLTRQCPRPRSNTRHPDKLKKDCTACGTLHQAGECPASSSVCFKSDKQGHYTRQHHSKIQSTMPSTLNSNRNTRGSWCGRGRGGRGCGSKRAVYETETTDTSKPIVDATNYDVNIIRLQHAYGMVPIEGSELKHRRKKVATDEISVIQTLALGDYFTFEPKHRYYMEVQLNVTLMYSGSPAKIL